MPGHTRSIYSRRQRLGPTRFDNPLADFLDRLPDYFNDYQRNQLALERQQLADKRYDDQQKQQEFANEIALLRQLPESAKAKAMMSSENEDIKELGRISEEEANAFDAMLKPPDPFAPTNELLSYYNSLENNPSVRGNKARLDQVRERQRSVKNSALQAQVQEWYKSNQNNPNAKIILQQSQYDPSGAIKNITSLKDPKERKIIKGRDGYNYYADTKERVLPNVKIPVVDKTATPNAQLEALTNLYNKAFLESKTNPEDEDLQKKLADLEASMARFTGVSLPNNRFGGLNTAPSESTGTRFDIKLDF
tara:strand:- start:5326 stop:6246 length:921 start_codon:yes stop_codon:yes gene_type:complete